MAEEIDAKLPMTLEDVRDSLSVKARAELDVAISTAKAYPRDIHGAISDILTLATLDEDTALEAGYALPRGGKAIRGASIRLAEIVASQWGNNRAIARNVSIDREDKIVTAEGIYIDLQKNSTISKEVSRRISDSKGRIYTDDMIIMTQNAAQSLALRNAIFAGIPKAVWGKAYAACQQIIRGDSKTLVERRERAMKAFAQLSVKPEQIFAVLDVSGIEDISLEHMELLLGMHSAIKNGEATVEELFDPRKIGPTHEVVSNPLKDEPDEKAQPQSQAAPAAPAEKTDAQKPQEAKPIDYRMIGVTAHKQGVPRDRPPGELRSPDRAADLEKWQSGWDSAG